MVTYTVKALSQLDYSLVDERKYFDEINARAKAMRMQDSQEYALCDIVIEVAKDGAVTAVIDA